MAKSTTTATAVNLVEEEFSDEILEMSLDDAVEALGYPSTEVILALVQKRQQWRSDKGKRPLRQRVDKNKPENRQQRNGQQRGQVAKR